MLALSQTDRLAPSDHQRVAEFVDRVAGIQLPAHKRQLIETRLRRRVKVTGRATVKAYLDFVFSDEGEAERTHLIDVITTNKTDFFRESAHFDFLSRYLEEQARNGVFEGREIRIWCAACSTGEEAYTLAMVLLEFQSTHPNIEFRIDATDICTSVLELARRGVYRLDRVAPVPERLKKKYFLRSRDPARQLVKVDRPLRERVRFGRFNLIGEDYPEAGRYDVVFCRNVMIYFSEADRQKVVGRLKHCLRPGGLLFLGHSESVGEQRQGLAVVSPTVYQRSAGA